MELLCVFFLAQVSLAWPSLFDGSANNALLEHADTLFKARSEALDQRVGDQVQTRRDSDYAAQAEYHKRQVSLGELSLGGGLLNGILQPFSGALAALDIPVPQETGIKEIPGDDVLHQFQYPRPSDRRGPCPALNSMANYGYISRDGITTFAEATNGCQLMFGVGYDNCVIVSAFSLLAGGDLPSGKFSIGGADARVLNTLGPSLGASRHGLFEIDSSITRRDIYFGNQADFHLDRFNRLVNISKKHNSQFGIPTFAEERVLIYNEAKKNNPDFTAQDVWLAVSNIERAFVFRGFINGTDPDNANYDSIASFFLNESTPRKWYRRGTPYILPDLGADIAALLSASSELTVPGQNQGFNNFVPLGLDISHVTPTTAICFIARAILDNAPGFVAPGFASNYKIVEAFVNGAVRPFFAPYNCSVDEFSRPGVNAGDSTPGVSTTSNILINGVYQPRQ